MDEGETITKYRVEYKDWNGEWCEYATYGIANRHIPARDARKDGFRVIKIEETLILATQPQ